MSISSPSVAVAARRLAWALPVAVIAGELLLISLAYGHGFDFTCRATAPAWFCAFAGRSVPRALGVLAALLLFGLARKQAAVRLLALPGQRGIGFGLNLLGLAVVFLPWFLLSDTSAPALVAAAGLAWIGGGFAMILGVALMLAPGRAWAAFVQDHALALGALLVAGLLLPEAGDLLKPLWRIETMTDVTFAAVLLALASLGYSVRAIPAEKIIGSGDFYVAVGAECSGVEGFMLITVFLTLYICLFRRDLRLPQVLVLYPIGIAVSWLFNVLRITGLLILGLEGHPDLAIGAFHSHAGWLAFTVLSILMILVAQGVPWFRSTPDSPDTLDALGAPAPRIPFFQDPAVVQIFPFVVFMASGLLIATVSESPGLFYPWRALAMAVGLALVWRGLAALPWRFDPVSAAAGLGVAALWIGTAPPTSDMPPPFAGLTGAALVLWMMVRALGTTLFVPVIEELFFRGYLMRLIAPRGQLWPTLAALGITAVLFGLLHDRWVVAIVAGLVFGGLVWRSGNVTDAIISHACANGVIVLWALLLGAWHIL